MSEDLNSQAIRLAAFEWLNSKLDNTDYIIDSKELSHGFHFKGERVALIGPKGIWKPQQINNYPISIKTVQGQYDASFIDEDLISYSYRGDDPNHFDNVSLREAFKAHVRLIYLFQVGRAKTNTN